MTEPGGPGPELGQRVGRAFFERYGSLRPVQQDALGPILAGHDVLIRAGTGSGKTEAATAPLVERLLEELDRDPGVTIVYLSPTRALANDLFRRLEPVFDKLGIVLGVRHGERDDLNRIASPGVLITTPESLDVMLGKKQEALRFARAVVLDEVHLLMNTQRGLQLALVLHRLELWLERDLQVIGLSATVADPQAVWQFFRPRNTPTIIKDDAPARKLHVKIRIDVSRAELSARFALIGRDESAKILVFTNSRRECDLLADELRSSATFGDHVYAHHSSLVRDQRLRVERDFEASDRAVCVATSTLELGIDIGDINLIVLYGVPADWQSFLQRVGRGNRRSDTIEALCVVPEAMEGRTLRLRDRLGFQAIDHQVESGEISTARAFELFGAAAQQLVSMVYAENGAFIGINRLLSALDPWPHLDHQTVESMLNELVAREVLQRHPVYRRFGAGDGLWQRREAREIWSNLPIGSCDVEIVHGSTPLGTVPGTNLLRLELGSVFVFSSRPWEVIGLHGDSIKVKPADRRPSVDLQFGRKGAPLDPAIADQIRLLIRDGEVARHVIPAEMRQRLIADFESWRPFASDHLVPVASTDGGHTYVTFAGILANQVLASWATGAVDGATEFAFSTASPISFDGLPTDPRDLLDHLAAVEMSDEQASGFQRLLPGDLRRRELMNEWLQRPTHEETLRRLRAAEQIGIPGALVDLINP